MTRRNASVLGGTGRSGGRKGNNEAATSGFDVIRGPRICGVRTSAKDSSVEGSELHFLSLHNTHRARTRCVIDRPSKLQ
jgi:hypothetical protein